MGNNKFLIIARREYITNFRRPVYLFMAFVFPVMLGAIMYLIFTLIGNAEQDISGFDRMGYVDLSAEGVLANVEPPGEDYESFTAFPDEDTARATFDADEIDAYFVVSEDYLQNGGQVEFYGTEELPGVVQSDIRDFLVRGLASLAPDGSNPDRLQDPVTVETFRFLNDDATISETEDFLARFFLPFGFAFFLYISITITSQFLMGSVVEEKESRMMEVLTTSLRPSELLWGKLLGLGAISLTQVVVWLTIGLLVASLQADIGDFIERGSIGVAELGMFLGLYLLTFFLFAGLGIGVGSVFSAEQEARQFATIFSFIAVAPMALITTFIEGGSIIAALFTMFPLTAPTSILLATAYGTVNEVYIYIGLVSLIVSIFAVMWASIRLFRAGMLLYGQRLGLKAIWRAVRSAS
jgi:ABC-2 type transport system permease protein